MGILWDLSRQDLAARTYPTVPVRSRATPALGKPQPWALATSMGMMCQDVGMWVGSAQQCPWLGRAELWASGDQPCSGTTEAGVDVSGG